MSLKQLLNQLRTAFDHRVEPLFTMEKEDCVLLLSVESPTVKGGLEEAKKLCVYPNGHIEWRDGNWAVRGFATLSDPSELVEFIQTEFVDTDWFATPWGARRTPRRPKRVRYD